MGWYRGMHFSHNVFGPSVYRPNADAHLEDTRQPPEYDDLDEDEVLHGFCNHGNPDDEDYRISMMGIDWDAEEW